MVVKVKKKLKRLDMLKNNNKSKKHNLRGHRNVKYHERIPSNKNKP